MGIYRGTDGFVSLSPPQKQIRFLKFCLLLRCWFHRAVKHTATSSLTGADNLELTTVYKPKTAFPPEYCFAFINFEFHVLFCCPITQ